MYTRESPRVLVMMPVLTSRKDFSHREIEMEDEKDGERMRADERRILPSVELFDLR